ncbi:Microtubule-associated serine/threonine-protein kinase 4 [Aix galericulata]|nr:Microtubule-associated serine/threonine-protein kinase 4 [Aix galericulata]
MGTAPELRHGCICSLHRLAENRLLDHILSPPPMPFRKSSNPEVISGPGKPFKFKRQLSEDGRQLRRGSLGGALTDSSHKFSPRSGEKPPETMFDESVPNRSLFEMGSSVFDLKLERITLSAFEFDGV